MERQVGDFIAKDRLGLQVAERMRAAIRTGEWKGVLPGIRVLMKRFGVSRIPVLDAMAILEQEGWIGPASLGKRREICALEATLSDGLIVFCREVGDVMPSTTAQILQDLDEWFLRKGVSVQQVIRDPRNPTVFVEALKEVFQKNPAILGVVALDVPHEELRTAIGPHCPLLLMGGKSIPDHNCASIGTKLQPLIEQALRHLFARGIKRQCLVLCGVPSSTVERIRNMARATYESEGHRFDADLHVTEVTEENLSRKVCELIQKEQPQVLLTIGDEYWARLQWEVHEQGAATKVLALWDSPQFKQFEQPPAVFTLNLKDFTKALQRWHSALRSRADYRFSQVSGARLMM